METTPLLDMQAITKIYDNGVVANDNASFSLRKGEIHAIAGENGAGKTTLMKVLYGLEKVDEGRVMLHGNEVNITSPHKAIEHGIGMVHQHFMLVDSLSVAENVMLGAEVTKRGFIDKSHGIQKTEAIAKTYGLYINPLAKTQTLSVGLKQRLEIIKVLARDVSIVILDEPTAVLTPQETVELFNQLKRLRNEGHSIVIITHKLKEIKTICDRVTVMRHGKTIGTYDVATITEAEISKRMIGAEVRVERVERSIQGGKPILEITNLTRHHPGEPSLHDVNLSIRPGEIIGVAGVEGNGQRTLIDILTGYASSYEGRVLINGVDIRGRSIKAVRELAVSHIPEDRMIKGSNPFGTIGENLVSTTINKPAFNRAKGWLINGRKIRQYTQRLLKSYRIKADNTDVPVRVLSGGNIQKVVCARELDSQPSLLIADQPSRGIDVGSMEFIHRQIETLASNGSAVLLVSADLREIFRLADTIYVIYNGAFVGAFNNDGSVREDTLGEYMLGIKRQAFAKEVARRDAGNAAL